MHNQVAGGDYTYVEALRRLQPLGVGASQQETRPAQGDGADGDDSSSSEDEGGSEGDDGAEPMDAEVSPRAAAPRSSAPARMQGAGPRRP